MDISTLKYQLRHSQSQADSLTKKYKLKIKEYNGLINRRLNTQSNQKVTNSKKYLFKKVPKHNIHNDLGNQTKIVNKSYTLKPQKSAQIIINQPTLVEDLYTKNNMRIGKKYPLRQTHAQWKGHQYRINNNFMEKNQNKQNRIINQNFNISCNFSKNKLRCRNVKRNLVNCVNYDDSMFNQQSLSKEKVKQKEREQSIEPKTQIHKEKQKEKEKQKQRQREKHKQKEKEKQKQKRQVIDIKKLKDNLIKGNNNYEILQDKLLGAGTFGKVYIGINKKTGQKVAIKKFYNDKSYKSRQVQLMQMVDSQNVIKIIDKFITNEVLHQQQTEPKQYTNIVMPKFESNLYQHLKQTNYKVNPYLLKAYLYQIFKGVLHLHSKGICHRDLKPHNILISKNKLVICDLGSAKILRKDQSNIAYICSRCYRAPELLFGACFYGVGIDIWSVGCIILQILNKGPLFIGRDSLHHLVEIIKVMGTPTHKQILSMNPKFDISSCRLPMVAKIQWKHLFNSADSQLLDLIQKIMVYNPKTRLTAAQALKHPYFDDIRNPQILERISFQMDTSSFLKFDETQSKTLKNRNLINN